MNHLRLKGTPLGLTVCLYSLLTLTACGGGTGDSAAVATSSAAVVASTETVPQAAPVAEIIDPGRAVAASIVNNGLDSANSAVGLLVSDSADAGADTSVPLAAQTVADTTVAPATTDGATDSSAAKTQGLRAVVTTTLPAVKAVTTAATVATTILATTAATSTAASLATENASAWPFVQPSLSTLRASPKKVFAHYFTPFPISLDNQDGANDYYTTQYMSASGEGGKFAGSGGFLKQRPLPRPIVSAAAWDAVDSSQDIRRAAALGIDGFAVDLLASSGINWSRAQRLLDTAYAVDPGFKIMLMPDMEGEFKSQPGNLLVAVRALAQHPAAYRLADGRLVLSPFNAQNQSPAWWQQQLATLQAEGISVAFFPVFQGWLSYANQYAAISYGMSDWGIRSPGANKSWQSMPAKAQAYKMKWMMPVAPQDSRAKDLLYWEAGNSENYRVMWENAINGGADWVQIITWNDYSEGTEIAPSSGTQWSFYDLTAYYTAWFKTGSKPAVAKDVLYYFHRIQSTTAASDSTKQTRPYLLGNGSDAPANDVELLAFATAPGTLQVTVGTQTFTRDVPSGMTSFKVPSNTGTPTFKLLRNNAPVAAVQSAFPISNQIVYQDLLYRGGSSSRSLVSPR